MLELTLLVAAAAGHHEEEATALGLNAGGWVALAMLAVFAIMLRARVPALVAGVLDKQIAQIRQQLDSAKALRSEAEALRDQYAGKLASAEADAAALLDGARDEAKLIVEAAEVQTTALIARRQKMAEDKIAAAERAAVNELRTRAAEASTAAARGLIRDKHTAAADKSLVDEAIAGL